MWRKRILKQSIQNYDTSPKLEPNSVQSADGNGTIGSKASNSRRRGIRSLREKKVYVSLDLYFVLGG